MVSSTKGQTVVNVDSALFNPDVVFILATLLDARDLCQMALTCKTLGGKHEATGLSLVEEVSRRMFQCATEWERSCLPMYRNEGWTERHHHLVMLRSKLTFDQLMGVNIQYGPGDPVDKSIVVPKTKSRVPSACMSINHVMRAGRHLAFFTPLTNYEMVGVIRPINQIDMSDFDYRELESSYYQGELIDFNPRILAFWRYLRSNRTERWGESDVHCCIVNTNGKFSWFDWESEKPTSMIDGFQRSLPIGLLLDFDEGTLSMYQDGQRLKTLKVGLAGEYCWYGAVWHDNASISIHRGPASTGTSSGDPPLKSLSTSFSSFSWHTA